MMLSTMDVDVMRGRCGSVLGIALGADFTTEHQIGQDGIRSLLRVGLEAFATPRMRAGMMCGADGKPALVGIDARRSLADRDVLDRHCVFVETNAETRMVVRFMRGDGDRSFWARNDLPRFRRRGEQGLVTAWDDRGFCIRAFSEEARAATSDLRKALYDRDVAIGLGGLDPGISGGGLRLPIISRLPPDLLAKLRDADIDRIELRKAAQATGIEKQLKTAGIGYFALAPAWARDVSLVGETRYPVAFFLNPQDQGSFHCGWFRVEDLRDWVRGRGPIIARSGAGSPEPAL